MINKKYNIKLNPEDYFYHGRWAAPPLSWSIWIFWALNPKRKLSRLNGHVSRDVVIDNYNFLEKKGLYQEIKEIALKELLEFPIKPGLTKEIFELADLAERDGLRMIKKINKSSEPLNLLKETLLLYEQAVFPHQMCIALGEVIEDVWKRIGYEKNILASVKPWREPLFLSDIKKLRTFKRELSKLNVEKNLSFSILKKVSPNLAAKIFEYKKETEYIGTHNFWGKPRTLNNLMKDINRVDLSEKISKNIKIRKLSSREKNILDLASMASFWRFQLPLLMDKIEYSFRPSLRKIGSKYGLSYDQIIFATHKEIIDEIDGEKKLDKAEILARIPEYSMYLNNRDQIVVLGRKETERLKKVFKIDQNIENVRDIKEIGGQIGSLGKTSGIATIVLYPADFSKVKKNSILIAPETTPDYLPVLARAKAFVTDRGGITSHAAIVAREMKKPCIIGTKIATKVLKDGDFVEVDADKGIVKIIKRA